MLTHFDRKHRLMICFALSVQFVILGLVAYQTGRSHSPFCLRNHVPVSNVAASAFQILQNELKDANTLLAAGPDHIQFIDGKNRLREYRYAYRSLWRNSVEVVSGLRGFFFEYRDNRGNLLYRSDRDLGRIESVGCTMRFAEEQGDVVDDFRVILPRISQSTIRTRFVGELVSVILP